MKADDPRLEQAVRQARERGQKFNEMILTVLKNHLLLEQFMNEALIKKGRRIRGLKFEDKLNECKQLLQKTINPPVWDLLTACNELRNKVAHTLDQEKIQKKIDKVRAAYLASLTPQQAEHSRGLDDLRIVAGAFELCGAFIVGATQN